MKDVESWGKWFGFLWLAFCSQWGDHHVRRVSKEGLNPSLYDLHLEWPQVDALLYHDQLIDAPSWGSPTGISNQSLHPLRGRDGYTPPAVKQLCHLIVDHSMERWSISLSQITSIILLIVQVPTDKGTPVQTRTHWAPPGTPHLCHILQSPTLARAR